jgi:hypothetical protein
MKSRRVASLIIGSVVAVLGCATPGQPSTNPVASPPNASVGSTEQPAPPTTRPIPTARTIPSGYEPGPAWEPFGDPIAFEPGLTTATTKRHGIRVTLTADSSRFSAAEGLWVTTRLENTGTNLLRWVTDGCAIHVGVSARTAFDWTYGVEQFSPYSTYKDWALERYDPNWERYPIYLETTPDWAVGKGEFGCADLGMGHDLKPGKSIEARHLVEALSGREGKYGIPPSGPILLSGSFRTWNRGKEDGNEVSHDPIVVRLAVELTGGRDAELISPGQAIDVALGSELLATAIRGNPRIPDFAPTILRLDQAAGRWIVGMTIDEHRARLSEGQIRARQVVVVVDARSATVLSASEEPYPG